MLVLFRILLALNFLRQTAKTTEVTLTETNAKMNTKFDTNSLHHFCMMYDKCCFEQGKKIGGDMAEKKSQRQLQGLEQELKLVKLTSGLQNVMLHERNKKLPVEHSNQQTVLKQETSQNLLTSEQQTKAIKALMESHRKHEQTFKKQKEINKK